MKAVYFAWVRERVGTSQEELAPPQSVATVADLMLWLKGRGDNYEVAFADMAAIRTALDREHVRHDASIAGAREIAFFPPMTGG